MNWTISTFIYIFFSSIGVCYFLGFWIPLHFNILDFLSPMDLIKSAAYPIIPAVIAGLFWVVVDTINTQGIKKTDVQESKFIKVLNGFLWFCLIILLLNNVFTFVWRLYHIFVVEPEKRLSLVLPIVTIVSMIYLLIKPPFLKDKNKFVRHFVIIFMCTLPTIAYYKGNTDITGILESSSSYYYLKTSSKNCKVDNNSKMIYLGFYGAKFFFLNSKTSDICIEKDDGVLLTYNKKGKRKVKLNPKGEDSNHEENIKSIPVNSD